MTNSSVPKNLPHKTVFVVYDDDEPVAVEPTKNKADSLADENQKVVKYTKDQRW